MRESGKTEKKKIEQPSLQIKLPRGRQYAVTRRGVISSLVACATRGFGGLVKWCVRGDRLKRAKLKKNKKLGLNGRKVPDTGILQPQKKEKNTTLRRQSPRQGAGELFKIKTSRSSNSRLSRKATKRGKAKRNASDFTHSERKRGEHQTQWH